MPSKNRTAPIRMAFPIRTGAVSHGLNPSSPPRTGENPKPGTDGENILTRAKDYGDQAVLGTAHQPLFVAARMTLATSIG